MISDNARNPKKYARNMMAIRGYSSQNTRILQNTYSEEFCSDFILLVVGCLARVLREVHFLAFLHVVYSACRRVFSVCILENIVCYAVF